MSGLEKKQLYDGPGLARIRRARKPGGLLAVWSAEGSSVFNNRLVGAGSTARNEAARERGPTGERHTIFLGAGVSGCASSARPKAFQ